MRANAVPRLSVFSLAPLLLALPLVAKLGPADFNGDGYGDAAIGAPGETLGGSSGAGAVTVFFGSKSGLKTGGSQFLRQGQAPIGDSAETNDGFGAALAAGDFNGDGKADLAIGAWNESVGAVAGAGQVHVVYGAANGLGTTKSQTWTQDSAGVPDVAEPNDFFGSILAAGDLNGDGYYDLAIGSPYEDLEGGPSTLVSAGAVHILLGAAGGLVAGGSAMLTQPGGPQHLGYFGAAIAIGDLGSGPSDASAVEVTGGLKSVDLVVSATGTHVTAADLDELPYAGRNFAYFTHTAPGLGAGPPLSIDQNTAGVQGDPEAFNQLGYPLLIGGAGRCIHAGAFGEDSDEADDVGTIHRICIKSNGSLSDRVFVRDLTLPALYPAFIEVVPNSQQTKLKRLFGGAPTKIYDGVQSGGVVEFLPNGRQTAVHYQGFDGIPGPAREGDSFGYDGDLYYARPDQPFLLISAPHRKVGTAEDAGEVHLLDLTNADPGKWKWLKKFKQTGTGDRKAEALDVFGATVCGNLVLNRF